MARIRTVALVLFALLAVPATAGAAHRHASRPVITKPVVTATAIARAYWGANPCGGRIKVLTQQALPPGLAPPSDAWAAFDSSLGANNLTAPPASYTNCVIGLAKWRWPDTKTMRADWDMLCLTVVHEMGHLLGHAHDTTPGSVMAPVFNDLSAEPKACRSARPRLK